MGNLTEGNWKELKGKLRQTWSKLTDDDIGRLQGNWEELAGKVQQLYGHTKERAWQDVEAFKSKFINKADQKDSEMIQKNSSTKI